VLAKKYRGRVCISDGAYRLGFNNGFKRAWPIAIPR